MSDWLSPLRHMLDRSPQPVRFFFRDNHVGQDNEGLRGVLDLFAVHRVPIDVAASAHTARAGSRAVSARVAPLRSAKRYWIDAQRPMTTDAAVQRPLSVDWCRHSPGNNPASRDHLGRLIAVAASRNVPVGIILDHSRINGAELRAIEQLLLVLSNHRKVQCVLMGQLADLSAANEDSAQAAESSMPQAADQTADEATRAERLTRVGYRWFARYRWLWLGGLVVLAVLGGARWLSGGPAETQLLTAPVLRGDIENAVLSAGTVQPYEFVDVGAQTSGQLKSLKVQLGDRVSKGQLLAEIDPVISESKVLEAEATLANLTAKRDGKRAKLALRQRQKRRSDELESQHAQAESAAEIAESNYELARNELAALEAQMKQAAAALQTARANLEYTRITAPMAGEVVSITAREGQTLNASQQAPVILRIATLDTMTVWALVPEADVSSLKIGQDVYFTVLGQDERRWTGRLRQILPSPEIIANVVFYNALFDVPNPLGELKVQMTAQVFFVADHAKDALCVPLAALHSTGSGATQQNTVRVLDKDGHVIKRKVLVGVTNAVSAQILSGVSEGEAVVIGTSDAKKDNTKPGVSHSLPRGPGPR